MAERVNWRRLIGGSSPGRKRRVGRDDRVSFLTVFNNALRRRSLPFWIWCNVGAIAVFCLSWLGSGEWVVASPLFTTVGSIAYLFLLLLGGLLSWLWFGLTGDDGPAWWIWRTLPFGSAGPTRACIGIVVTALFVGSYLHLYVLDWDDQLERLCSRVLRRTFPVLTTLAAARLAWRLLGG